MFNRIKILIETLGIAQTIYWLFSLPVVVTMLTAIAGYFGNIPIMWVIMASAITFAAMTTGVLRFSEWSFRNSANGKLDYIGPHVAANVIWDAKGKAKWFLEMNFGVQVRNNAHFPIEWNFLNFGGLIENRAAHPVPANFVAQMRTAVPNSLMVTYPGKIDIGDLKKSVVNGKLDFEIAYGKPGDLRYRIKRAVDVEIVLNKHTSQRPNLKLGIAPRDRE